MRVVQSVRLLARGIATSAARRGTPMSQSLKEAPQDLGMVPTSPYYQKVAKMQGEFMARHEGLVWKQRTVDTLFYTVNCIFFGIAGAAMCREAWILSWPKVEEE